MKISLSNLGASQLQDQILNDVDDLMQIAKKRNLKPFLLIVGSLFVEVAAVQSLIKDLTILNWRKELKTNKFVIQALLQSKKLQIYEMCENNEGRFATDEDRDLEIYLDPDESYLTLKCVDPNTPGRTDQAKTKEGYLIVNLKLKDEEILVDFKTSDIH